MAHELEGDRLPAVPWWEEGEDRPDPEEAEEEGHCLSSRVASAEARGWAAVCGSSCSLVLALVHSLSVPWLLEQEVLLWEGEVAGQEGMGAQEVVRRAAAAKAETEKEVAAGRSFENRSFYQPWRCCCYRRLMAEEVVENCPSTRC